MNDQHLFIVIGVLLASYILCGLVQLVFNFRRWNRERKMRKSNSGFARMVLLGRKYK